MAQVDHHLDLVIRSAWVESTLRTRNSQWKRFLNFCEANGLTPLPVDVLTVAKFLIDLSMTCKFTTCNNYLSSIISLHKFFGEDHSFRDSFVIQLVIKGLGKRLGKTVSQKLGLTPNEMLDIYQKLDFSDINTITKWSALVFSFRTLLRKSNIVQSTLNNLGMAVTRSDIVFNETGLIVNVRKTKTIQAKEYVLQIPVFFTNCSGLCAASMV